MSAEGADGSVTVYVAAVAASSLASTVSTDMTSAGSATRSTQVENSEVEFVSVSVAVAVMCVPIGAVYEPILRWRVLAVNAGLPVLDPSAGVNPSHCLPSPLPALSQESLE